MWIKNWIWTFENRIRQNFSKSGTTKTYQRLKVWPKLRPDMKQKMILFYIPCSVARFVASLHTSHTSFGYWYHYSRLPFFENSFCLFSLLPIKIFFTINVSKELFKLILVFMNTVFKSGQLIYSAYGPNHFRD